MSNTTSTNLDNSSGTFDIIRELDSLLDVTDSEGNRTSDVDLSYYKSAGSAYIFFNLVTVALGLIGNVMVMLLTSDVKFSFLSFPIYLRFLAVSDSVVLIMLSIQESLRYFQSFHLITDSVNLCRFWKTTKYTVTLLSPWLVAGLSSDRFYCVVYPLTRHRFCTRTKAVVVCSSLTITSIGLMLPLLDGVEVVPGTSVCFVVDRLVTFYAVIRLFVNSLLPCLLILIFNIAIGIHIQRSVAFRTRFTRSRSNPREDKSLRPLVLISILAFVTILPSTIAESIIGILLVTKTDHETVKLVVKSWAPLHILFLMNFGQNFYILMATSANYRNIIKDKLRYRKDNAKGKGKDGRFMATTVSGEVSDLSESKINNSGTRVAITLQSTSVSSPVA